MRDLDDLINVLLLIDLRSVEIEHEVDIIALFFALLIRKSDLNCVFALEFLELLKVIKDDFKICCFRVIFQVLGAQRDQFWKLVLSTKGVFQRAKRLRADLHSRKH